MMNFRSRKKYCAWIAAACVAGGGSAFATLKDNTGTDLSLPGSWQSLTGNVPPGPGDVAEFDGTANPTAYTLGADDAWAGITLDTTAPNVTISGTNLLTLGGSGIKLLDSGKTLALQNTGLALAAAQTWSTGTVASGLVTFNGTTNLGNFLLTIDGVGKVSVTGIISGNGGIEKDGTGTLTLSALNNYAGGTTINSGVLIAGTGTTQTTALGTGLVTLNGTADLRIGINNLALKVEGLASTSSTAVVEAFGGNNTQGTLTIDRAPGQSSTYAGIIRNGNGTTGTLTLAITGGGTETLSGTSTYTGSTLIHNGTLIIPTGGMITSSNATSTGSSQFGTIQVGDTAGQKGILEIDGGTVFAAHNGEYGAATMTTGDNGGDGAIYLNSGQILTGVNEFWTGSTGSGYLRMTGGTLTSLGYFAIGRPVNTNNPAGTGVVEVMGGTLNHMFHLSTSQIGTPEKDFEVGAYDPNKIADPTHIHGVLNVSGGDVNVTVGNFQVSNFLSGVATLWNNGLIYATALSGTDIQNHDGSDTDASTHTKAGTGYLGVFNLGAVNGGGFGSTGGGTLTTSHVMHTGLNTGLFNFHGGTLKAATNSSTMNFMTGLTHVYVYGEGGTIDTSGMALTIDQPLETPTGYGLATIPLSSGGSGYISPPVVTILGGTGAALSGTSLGITASAIFDINTGTITGIAITNPGSGLQLGDSLTITLSGGGFTTPAVLTGGSVTLLSPANSVANTGGKLTFTGGGIATLSGANVLTGGIGITGGTTVQFGGNVTQTYGPITQGTAGAAWIRAGTTVNAGPITLNSLEVDGVLNLSDTPAHATKIVQALTFVGGTLNIKSNALVVQASPDGMITKNALLAQMAVEILSGASGGLWNGPGIDSSFVGGNPANLTIALIDDADGIWPTGGIDQPVNVNSVIALPALIGDLNGDGNVNAADFALWAAHAYTADFSYDHGDITHDGLVNNADFNLWYAHDPNANADMAADGWALVGGVPVQVPEPASLAVLGLGALWMCARSRRRTRR